MSPVLYAADETSFNTNGFGRLSDAISCTVTEALNGAFTLAMVYPKDGIHASDIAYKCIIKADASETLAGQLFRITKIQDSSDGRKMTISADHISYDLNGFPMPEFTATGITNVMNALQNNSLVGHSFNFDTDITNTTSKINSKYPKSIRAVIGGEEGSIIQIFKCEVEFSNFMVRLLRRRGADNSVSIRYGKNLESFVNVRSSESSYNGVLAFWYSKDAEGTKYVRGNIAYSANHTEFPVDRIFLLDVTSEYDEAPTQAQLTTRAASYVTDNNIGYPYLDSVTIKFIPLWQTEEFKNVVGLEQVSIGDTVHVYYEDFDFAVRVIEYTYDTLEQRYTNITLGSKKASFAETIKQISMDTVNEAINR